MGDIGMTAAGRSADGEWRVMSDEWREMSAWLAGRDVQRGQNTYVKIVTGQVDVPGELLEACLSTHTHTHTHTCTHTHTHTHT